MELALGGRRKKLILALEHGHAERRTCSECTPKLQRKIACGRDGAAGYDSDRVWRFTSPRLQGLILRECPTGYLWREHRWVYDVIEACNLAENASPNEAATWPVWYKQAARLVASERSRLREMDRTSREAARSSADRLSRGHS